MKTLLLYFSLICAFLAAASAADPMRDPKSIPNLPNFKWLERIYSEGNVSVYRGKSKNYIYSEHLGVWNNSGRPITLKIDWIGFENTAKKRSFETPPIAPSSSPAITLLRVPGFTNTPGINDDSAAFKDVWINGKKAQIIGMTR